MKTPSLVLAALALAGCGAITVRTVVLDNMTVLVPSESPSATRVAYSTSNQFASVGQKLPGFLSLSVTANATYKAGGFLGATGSLREAKVYVRTDLQALRSNPKCTESAGFIICEGLDESAFAAGTLTLGTDRKGRMELSGPALNAAARASVGYFGVALTQGSTVAGEAIELTDVTAQVRF